MSFYEELEWRGLIKDCSSPDLKEKLNAGGMRFYIGADPTAESLHIGQYPTFLMVERLRRNGHHPMVLIGGATGRVGDPRGTGEREKADISVIEHNFGKIRAQMNKLFGDSVQIVNNFDWFQNINYIDFLRDVGKYINVNYMINKDLVKRQMEVGISYAEFSYMLIQGYDFKVLHDKYGVNLQFGGSDQWGNLTTGIELIRKLNDEVVYAFSCPLTLDASGKKIGKSEGNALWLDKEKTSSYELYQYLINFEDVMHIMTKEEFIDSKCKELILNKGIILLREVPVEEIENILNEHSKAPEKRLAQKTLAEEVITYLHGESSYHEAVEISEALFSGDIKRLNGKEIEMAFKGLTPKTIEEDINIVDLLVEKEICKSKREAREFISNGSITVNGDKVTDNGFNITKSVAIEQKYIVIRRGKKKYYIVTFE